MPRIQSGRLKSPDTLWQGCLGSRFERVLNREANRADAREGVLSLLITLHQSNYFYPTVIVMLSSKKAISNCFFEPPL
ncbi:hypothetical protein VTK26DRAFT_3741 [Humicola hyalothermophila]